MKVDRAGPVVLLRIMTSSVYVPVNPRVHLVTGWALSWSLSNAYEEIAFRGVLYLRTLYLSWN